MAHPTSTDMAQFFDFGEAAMPDVTQEPVQDIATTQTDDNCPNQQDSQGASTEFNTDFSSWLPRYSKPATACDYCRSRGLECFIYDCDGSGRVRCSPCNALFRPCSFSDPEKMPAIKQKTALDTLDVVGEDDERCFGGLTGKKQLRSLGHMGPIEDDNQTEERPKKGAAAARFPRAAIAILKDWMVQHIDHPYPTEEEKEVLKQQTGLSVGQISNWMANTRRRQKARPKRCASPSLRPSTEAINIPAGRTWESLNPLERWKHSPPENEPAPLNAIAHAVETFDLPEATNTSASSSYRRDNSNDSTGSFSLFRAPSISSLETGLTNVSSNSLGSFHSAYSHGSRHSLGSLNSLKAKERRRRRRLPTRTAKVDSDDGPRLFQCTFCTDRFKSKYDWSRHEKSLHLSLEKWICAPLGEVIADTATGKRKCVYCDALEPSEEHLATHGHKACEEKGRESRTFYRKDHLRQHLRLMHGCKMTSSMESWKSEAQYIKSRCGFCNQDFTKWQDRVDHLAKEFRSGANIKDWKGCRGLDAHVAIHVTNAMPPYLIANESKSPFPFSASNHASIKQAHLHLDRKDLEYLLPNDPQAAKNMLVTYPDDHEMNRIGPIVLSTQETYTASETPFLKPNATCWEVLTLRLGRFARQYIEKHGAASITDEMLQNEARLILYGESDGWEQTAADNPEWLNLFKKAHGIDLQVSTGINARHEIFEDLGIHESSTLDPSFNIGNFHCTKLAEDDPNRAIEFQCSLSGLTTAVHNARKHSYGDQSSYSLPGLSGTASGSPISPAFQTPVTTSDHALGGFPIISELACTGPGGPCYGENGEAGFATRKNKGCEKKRYWLNDQTASFATQCVSAGKPVYECAKVGLRSFSPMDKQACSTNEDALMPQIQEKECNKAGDLIDGDFQFPSWEDLPADLQNPTTSADFCSTIPISTSNIGMSGMPAFVHGGEQMRWDNDEMNFAMDMDMDLDMELDIFGKC